MKVRSKEITATGKYKMKTVKVTAKGQITLPASLREELKISEGNYLDASIFLDGILLKPVREGHELVREYCEKYSSDKPGDNLEAAKRILKKVPFSLAERSAALREEQ
jgi:AbrB family looped-hinge helix DNA binding protein